MLTYEITKFSLFYYTIIARKHPLSKDWDCCVNAVSQMSQNYNINLFLHDNKVQ